MKDQGMMKLPSSSLRSTRMLLEILHEIKRKYLALKKRLVTYQRQRHFQYNKERFHFKTLLGNQIKPTRLFLINPPF